MLSNDRRLHRLLKRRVEGRRSNGWCGQSRKGYLDYANAQNQPNDQSERQPAKSWLCFACLHDVPPCCGYQTRLNLCDRLINCSSDKHSVTKT